MPQDRRTLFTESDPYHYAHPADQGMAGIYITVERELDPILDPIHLTDRLEPVGLLVRRTEVVVQAPGWDYRLAGHNAVRFLDLVTAAFCRAQNARAAILELIQDFGRQESTVVDRDGEPIHAGRLNAARLRDDLAFAGDLERTDQEGSKELSAKEAQDLLDRDIAAFERMLQARG